MRWSWRHVLVALLLVLNLGGAAAAQQGQQSSQDPQQDATDLINTLLGGMLGFKDMSEAELQQEVAEVGGIPFRSRVPLDYMSRDDMVRYLKEVFDAEYPSEKAVADQRTLIAFDLLPPGTDLRGTRARLLEDNVAGFYDERPGKKRLYAVSADRRLTPANQIILAHELRHAVQDQYVELHELLPDAIGDFDDRRMALVSLLEGDATLVMEQFLTRHLPGLADKGLDFSELAVPGGMMPGVAPVLQEQLVRPYLAGRNFARTLWESGGWDAVKAAWSHPPQSTEQVLHPSKYVSGEAPQNVTIAYSPSGATLVSEGVLGEMLLRPLLGEGSDAAAAGWGGDRYKVWDVKGKTLLVWRSQWDTGADADEFLAAARARFTRSSGPGREQVGWIVFHSGDWTRALSLRSGAVLLVASDSPAALEAALRGSL
jgi:hypothetical protein